MVPCTKKIGGFFLFYFYKKKFFQLAWSIAISHFHLFMVKSLLEYNIANNQRA